jgi:two-component system response regulator RegX3
MASMVRDAHPTVPQRDVKLVQSLLERGYGQDTMTVPAPADPSATRPRVLVVEDEAGIADPFVAALEREGFLPRLARTAAAARAVLAEPDAADLVVLDLALPDGDGRDLCRELRRTSEVPILMLTARGTEADRIVGLELGADDYVVKPFSAAEVAARIRAILRRTAAPAPPAELVAVGELEVDLGARRVRLAGEEVHLTRKEFDLLARLLADRGRVVTREDLMTDVWDTNWFGSTRTLDVHVGLLRRKLGDDPAVPRYLHTVRGVGFRFVAPDEPTACG